MAKIGLKQAVAIAVCACALTGSAAHAQQALGSSWLEGIDLSMSPSSRLSISMSSPLEMSRETFVVNRFGMRDGELVAYGRLVPTQSASGVSLGAARSLALGSSGGWQGGSGSSSSTGGIDLQMGPTSGNDRTSIDLQMDRTSENDRTAIDLQFGPTSGNDRVAGGPIDLEFGPTSSNDRTSIDLQAGPTSANDRTAVDLSVGPTSGNDRVAVAGDVHDRPLIQLGGSQMLYTGRESERARMAGTSDIALPVRVVSASCDAVTLSFSGSAPVVLRASGSDPMRSTLCAVSEASESHMSTEANARLLKQLSRLVSQVQ